MPIFIPDASFGARSDASGIGGTPNASQIFPAFHLAEIDQIVECFEAFGGDEKLKDRDIGDGGEYVRRRTAIEHSDFRAGIFCCKGTQKQNHADTIANRIVRDQKQDPFPVKIGIGPCIAGKHIRLNAI